MTTMQEVTFDDVTDIDLDGHVDKRGVEYFGQARRHRHVPSGCLCVVEVRVRPEAA